MSQRVQAWFRRVLVLVGLAALPWMILGCGGSGSSYDYSQHDAALPPVDDVALPVDYFRDLPRPIWIYEPYSQQETGPDGSVLAGTGATAEDVSAVEEALKAFEGESEGEYHLGSGDIIHVNVWNRPELSGIHTIGPDGYITVPVAGPLRLGGETRQSAAELISQGLGKHYEGVVATVGVQQYSHNRLIVLGQVGTPGVFQFDSQPRLLEAISRAGGIRTEGRKGLPNCAILRGRDKVAWIRLTDLLRGGQLALNLRLQPDDVVYVPDWEDRSVFILGEVNGPGLYPLRPDSSAISLIAAAGGPTRDAAPGRMILLRPSTGQRIPIDLNAYLAQNFQVNIELKDGDLLFVPPNNISKVGYVLRNLNPLSWLFLVQPVE